MDVCMYVCMDVCRDVCMDGCMYVCMYVSDAHTHTHAFIFILSVYIYNYVYAGLVMYAWWLIRASCLRISMLIIIQQRTAFQASWNGIRCLRIGGTPGASGERPIRHGWYCPCGIARGQGEGRELVRCTWSKESWQRSLWYSMIL